MQKQNKKKQSTKVSNSAAGNNNKNKAATALPLFETLNSKMTDSFLAEDMRD